MEIPNKKKLSVETYVKGSPLSHSPLLNEELNLSPVSDLILEQQNRELSKSHDGILDLTSSLETQTPISFSFEPLQSNSNSQETLSTHAERLDEVVKTSSSSHKAIKQETNTTPSVSVINQSSSLTSEIKSSSTNSIPTRNLEGGPLTTREGLEFDNVNEILKTTFPLLEQLFAYLRESLKIRTKNLESSLEQNSEQDLNSQVRNIISQAEISRDEDEDEEEIEKLIAEREEKQRIDEEERQLTERVFAAFFSSLYCLCCGLFWISFCVVQFNSESLSNSLFVSTPEQRQDKLLYFFCLCLLYMILFSFSLTRFFKTKNSYNFRSFVLFINILFPCLFQLVFTDLSLFTLFSLYSFSVPFSSILWWPSFSDYLFVAWIVIHSVLIPSYFRIQGIELSVYFFLSLVSLFFLVCLLYFTTQQLYSRLVRRGQELSIVKTEIQNISNAGRKREREKERDKNQENIVVSEIDQLDLRIPLNQRTGRLSLSDDSTKNYSNENQQTTTSAPSSPIGSRSLSLSSSGNLSVNLPSLSRSGSVNLPSRSGPIKDAQPTFDFPLEKVIKVIHKLKENSDYEGNSSDLDYVLKTLSSKEGRALFASPITKHNAPEIEDKVTRSVVFYHTNQKRLRFSTPSTPSSPTSPSGGSTKRLKLRASKALSECLSHVDEWNFDIFELYHLTKGRPLFYLAWTIFEKRQLITKFNIEPQKLRTFLTTLEKGYHQDNPYHNNIHACDVLQTLNFFITSGGLSSYLMDVDIFAAYISAMIHDYDHPGKNNAFMINSQSSIALTYNDKSVLENYHCAEAFKILKETKSDIFSGVSSEQKRELRDTIINMVLATDFSEHMSFLGKFKARKAVGPFDPLKREDRHMLLYFSIKCADLGHTAKNFDHHLNWTERISEEFFSQGDMEKKLGLPVSPFMDREQANIAKSQAGFLNYLVLPLYKEYVELFENCQVCLDQLESNLDHWKECEQIPPTNDYSVYAIKRKKSKKVESNPETSTTNNVDENRFSVQKKFDLNEEENLFEEEEEEENEEVIHTATEHRE